MMQPRIEQVKMALEVAERLEKYGMAYLAAEERTGKTLSAIVCFEATKCERVLVLTKKKALDGWHHTLNNYETKIEYVVTNYHQAHKVTGTFDAVILDEAHSYISGFPKPSAIWKAVKELTKDLPILYLSATPHAQGYHLLFHQFKLCSFHPWSKYQNFYKWHAEYGIPYTIPLYGREVKQYDRTKGERIRAEVEKYFVTYTRRELGFEHEPEDELHYIELGEATKWTYNYLVKNELVPLKAGLLVADSPPKMRAALHQLEGGAIKLDEQYVVLGNTEKVDYIKKHFGDTKDVVIMYNYKAEKLKLEAEFKNARILQATSYAEGVDLSMYKHLIIYSMNFSTSQHTQRRARQANKLRSEPINVHYLLVKGGVSEKAYKSVAKKKKNFVDTVFEAL